MQRSPWADGGQGAGARTLWLLRHAKTVTDPPPGGPTSIASSPRGAGATPPPSGACSPGRVRGWDPASRASRGPRSRSVSPAARTTATAELVLAGMADPPQCRFDEALYGADPDEVLTFVRALPDDVGAAMVVGHNPTAQSLSQGLLSAREQKGLSAAVRHGFPTCALGVYSFRVDRWADVAAGTAKLVALLNPPY